MQHDDLLLETFSHILFQFVTVHCSYQIRRHHNKQSIQRNESLINFVKGKFLSEYYIIQMFRGPYIRLILER